MPGIPSLLRPCLLTAPVWRKIIKTDGLDAESIWNIVSDHDKFGKQSRILDVNEFLQDTEGGRGRAIGDRMSHRVPSAVKMQAIAAVKCLGVLPA